MEEEEDHLDTKKKGQKRERITMGRANRYIIHVYNFMRKQIKKRSKTSAQSTTATTTTTKPQNTLPMNRFTMCRVGW